MKLAVIGTGYVGLVTGTCLAEMGNDVTCVDNDSSKLDMLKNSELPIYEPGLDVLFHRNIAKKRLVFTGELNHAVVNSDLIFLCLPTPQDEKGAANLNYVYNVAEDIGRILSKEGDTQFKIIVNKSTVPVGTSRAVTEILNKHKLKNFEVVSNPEFLREGFAVEDFMKPDRIVIGARSEEVFSKMKLLYAPFVRQGNPILEMNPESSEVTKYAANSYLAMRITFMNELANFCEKVGADVDVVRKGMGTDTRIGKRFLFPGIGYGGSCFPKDVNALIRTSKESGAEMSILTQVDKVNKKQKLVLVDKVLNHFGNDISGKKFAVWGLAFKPNTDDMREAPSIVIINKLLELEASVHAYDPEAMKNAKLYFGDKIVYADNEYDSLKDADALLILTEWNEFRNPDFNKLKAAMKGNVIFDGRNIFDIKRTTQHGFVHYSIGKAAVKPE